MILGSDLKGQSKYSLSWKKEGLTWAGAIGSTAISLHLDKRIERLKLSEIDVLNANEINFFDRSATRFYSKTVSQTSDFLLISGSVAPLFLFLDEQIRSDLAPVFVMYLETMSYSAVLPTFGKGTVQRIRPYVYNPDTPSNIKTSRESKKSFFSGHASFSFSTTVFFASVYTKYHPESKKIVWPLALLTSSTVGFLRYRAGMHFPSDILVGAIVGSGIGYLIPKIHECTKDSSWSILPQLSSRSGTLSLRYTF